MDHQIMPSRFFFLALLFFQLIWFDHVQMSHCKNIATPVLFDDKPLLLDLHGKTMFPILSIPARRPQTKPVLLLLHPDDSCLPTSSFLRRNAH